MRISLAVTLTSLLVAGNALAADAFRIESEAQFVHDYGDQVEQLAPGVYQVVHGTLAGKTITLGETGLAYDLAALRAQTPRSSQLRAQMKTEIRKLELIRARFVKLRDLQARDLSKKAAYGSLPCYYHNPWDGTYTSYSAFADVKATTELYMDNGGGGLNYYYARASASATGNVLRAYGVPPGAGLVSVSATAKNLSTGQTVHRNGISSGIGVSTGYVYSGPAFSHNLTASASVYGGGDCFGYVAISDAMQ